MRKLVSTLIMVILFTALYVPSPVKAEDTNWVIVTNLSYETVDVWRWFDGVDWQYFLNDVPLKPGESHQFNLRTTRILAVVQLQVLRPNGVMDYQGSPAGEIFIRNYECFINLINDTPDDFGIGTLDVGDGTFPASVQLPEVVYQSPLSSGESITLYAPCEYTGTYGVWGTFATGNLVDDYTKFFGQQGENIYLSGQQSSNSDTDEDMSITQACFAVLVNQFDVAMFNPRIEIDGQFYSFTLSDVAIMPGWEVAIWYPCDGIDTRYNFVLDYMPANEEITYEFAIHSHTRFSMGTDVTPTGDVLAASILSMQSDLGEDLCSIIVRNTRLDPIRIDSVSAVDGQYSYLPDDLYVNSEENKFLSLLCNDLVVVNLVYEDGTIQAFQAQPNFELVAR